MAATPSVLPLPQISFGSPALAGSLTTAAAMSSSLFGPALLSAPAVAGLPAVAVPPPPVEYYPSYAFQGYIGFDFIRFYQTPGVRINLPGVYGSMAYYVNQHLGVEGVIAGGFGNQYGEKARMSFVGGGARYRYPVGFRIEPFVHGDFGFAHYVPQTAKGSQGAIGASAGGGVDFRMKRWLSFRIQGDALFTRFFSANQVGPMISGGAVINY